MTRLRNIKVGTITTAILIVSAFVFILACFSPQANSINNDVAERAAKLHSIDETRYVMQHTYDANEHVHVAQVDGPKIAHAVALFNKNVQPNGYIIGMRKHDSERAVVVVDKYQWDHMPLDNRTANNEYIESEWQSDCNEAGLTDCNDHLGYIIYGGQDDR